MQAHCLASMLALSLLVAVPVRGTTTSQFVAWDKNQQVLEIRRLCNNVVTNFSQRSEGGKPISEVEYQKRRQVANFVRALFLRPSTEVRDSLIESVIYQAKQTAKTSPSADVAESLQKIVFEYFDKFNSPGIAGASDADQQAYFLKQYIDYYQRDLDEYHKKMDDIIRQEKELQKQAQQQLQEAKQLSQEMDCRTTRLNDGRRAYRDGDQYRDDQGRVLQGQDRAEARRNEIDLSNAADRQKYRACLAEHGIAHLDRTAPRPAPVPAPAPAPPPAPTDNPLGPGGFITPATVFDATICVAQNLVDRYSWNQPEPGSKMAQFKSAVARYVFSSAKVGWQYWIAESQFTRYNPAAPPGDSLVSSVSPGSGRFDEFDPRCPANYATFTVHIGR